MSIHIYLVNMRRKICRGTLQYTLLNTIKYSQGDKILA